MNHRKRAAVGGTLASSVTMQGRVHLISMLSAWRFIKVYRLMWFSSGITACNVFMTVRGKLAYLSSGISTWQSTSVQRTISGVFLVFVSTSSKYTVAGFPFIFRLCSANRKYNPPNPDGTYTENQARLLGSHFTEVLLL